jgi:membrane-associated phospholipid phosphatase
MNVWLDWGLPIITWLQGLGDWLLVPMQSFTFLGSENFFLLIMPALIWCFEFRLGFRIGLIMLTGQGLNSCFKLFASSPRPFWVSSEIKALSTETSFGIPSGHSSSAVVVWGRLAAGIRKRWATILLALLIFMISISRLYLGVHFPTDVLTGWLVGVLILLAFLRFEDPVGARLSKLGVPLQIGIAFLASIAIILFGLLAQALSVAPLAEWVQTAAQQGIEIDARSIEGVISSAGALFGLGAGGALIFAQNGFDASGAWWKRILRYLVGVVGVALIYFGLKLVLPEGIQLLRYLRYALVGFWVSYLAPLTFVALRLA